MEITKEKFSEVKSILMGKFPYNQNDIESHVRYQIENALKGEDATHVLIDGWCGEETEYYASPSECSLRSWEDHCPSRCLTCKIIIILKRR